MSIPLPTTTITIRRPRVDPDRDGTLPPLPSDVIATGIPAHIGGFSATERRRDGSTDQATARLTADLCDLQHTDTVVDEQNGVPYSVTGVRPFVGVGLSHVQATLSDDRGGSR